MTDNYASDYKKYRGKCKEMCEEILKEKPHLRLVRGHYFEPMWNRDEPHWWLEDTDGTIIDPTKKQFPSGGIPSLYTEFNGIFSCETCGKNVKEKDAIPMGNGNYIVCSHECGRILVGL